MNFLKNLTQKFAISFDFSIIKILTTFFLHFLHPNMYKNLRISLFIFLPLYAENSSNLFSKFQSILESHSDHYPVPNILKTFSL